jgi:hypothetical protein
VRRSESADPGGLRNKFSGDELSSTCCHAKENHMGRYLLLWLLGIPIPVLILIWAFGGLN